jgi:hypothetical protein
VNFLPKRLLLFGLTFVAALSASSSLAAERGVLVREATIYISPDPNSAKLAELQRGREVAILETTRGWLHVFASVTEKRDVTGWVADKGVVRPSTPNGDQILYGEAVDCEREASRRYGRKGADQDAFRLYRMTAEQFPNSPLAAEAFYRAADIRWQLERAETRLRPSAKEQDPLMRHAIEEDMMREVIKRYRGTKWADLAAYHLLDNKLCGEWKAQPKCPEREAEIYEKYVAEHPQSPVAPEALYNAAWRRAALIDLYKAANQPGKSAEAKTKALALTQRLTAHYTQGDWAPRARTLQYLIEQEVPTYATTTSDSGISEFKP